MAIPGLLAAARLVLLGVVLAAALASCSSRAGVPAPQKPATCKGATDCASCLEVDAELCIWCAGSGACQEWSAGCSSVSGNHGYITAGTLYPRVNAAQATAVCALPCGVYGELTRDAAGATLNPDRCCSSSPPEAGTNGLSCPRSNAGEPCAIDDGCVAPETCQNGVCVGMPNVQAVACRTTMSGCFCDVETVAPTADAGTLACGTSSLPNGVCCAPDGWPTPTAGSGGTCECWSVTCADLGSGCQCGASVSSYPNLTSSCSGALCCSEPAALGCGCVYNVSPGDTCLSRFGPDQVQVASCSTATVGCAAPGTPGGGPNGYHPVSSCSGG